MNKEEIKAILEGLLYIVGDEGVTIDQCSMILNLIHSETKLILQEMMEQYRTDVHGIELINYGEVYKFVSKESIHEYAQQLFKLNKNMTLSSAALETLAIIAYKQPITRVEIEEIRGVGCDMMLRKLLLRNLIKETGRAEAPGKPILYEVTKEFMDVFKLVSLKELPELPTYDSGLDGEHLFD